MVVDDNGYPRLINFKEFDTHKCECADRKFRVFEDQPELLEIRCTELWEACLEMDIFTPSEWLFPVGSVAAFASLLTKVRSFSQLHARDVRYALRALRG